MISSSWSITEAFVLPVQERNWARLVILKPEYRDLSADWEQRPRT